MLGRGWQEGSGVPSLGCSGGVQAETLQNLHYAVSPAV